MIGYNAKQVTDLLITSRAASFFADLRQGQVFRLRACIYLPAFPSRRHSVVDSGLIWAFVPFTAAGQREPLTPLPWIPAGLLMHSYNLYLSMSLFTSFHSISKSSAGFVGTACPGAGRGRRLPQRICNTPGLLLLDAAAASLIWKWHQAASKWNRYFSVKTLPAHRR